jgi:histidyl-tRNA synthetase
MKLQTAKGVRDFLPKEKIAREKVVSTIKEVFELYGFPPLETPILERLDVLASKYAGGAEILKETFKLKDQGDRDLALRYDLTVPLSRVIGMNPQLRMPFKRYAIGRVFRDGPIKLGRYREFWQCDVDIIGVRQMSAEAELLSLTSEVFKNLKLDVVIRVNNRKILNGIIAEAGIEKAKEETVILTLDKLEKFGQDYVVKELIDKGISKKTADELLTFVTTRSIAKLAKLIKNEEGKQGLKELEELFTLLKQFNVKNAIFDTSLARGLSYYTGTVYEVFMNKGEIKSSIAAGGRYDKMIGSFLESKREYPAVGISFGLNTLMDAIKTEYKETVSKVFVIPINTFKQSIKIVKELRENNIKADIDLMERGPSKNLKYANGLGIPFVLFIGEDEIKKKKFKLKDMESGKERTLIISSIIKELS